jgi:hypothetical protein
MVWNIIAVATNFLMVGAYVYFAAAEKKLGSPHIK